MCAWRQHDYCCVARARMPCCPARSSNRMRVEQGACVAVLLQVPTCAATAEELLQRIGDAHLPAVVLKVPLLQNAPSPSANTSAPPTSSQDVPERTSSHSDVLGSPPMGVIRPQLATPRQFDSPAHMAAAAAAAGATPTAAAAAAVATPAMTPHAHVITAGGKRRLVPVWCNAAACAAYALSDAHDFVRILQRLAARDPLLVYVLQKAVNAIVSAAPSARQQASALHVTADPVATIPSLLGLRVTGIWWQAEDGCGGMLPPEPGVMLQLGVSYNAGEVSACVAGACMRFW